MPITIENNSELVSRNIIRDMSDGVVYTGPTGKILVVNDAATRILERSREELVGKNFATCFFGYEENDGFNDCIVNMISQKDVSPNKKVTDFYTGKEFKKLYLTTSYTQDDEGNITGTILILDDITQTMKLQERLFRNQLEESVRMLCLDARGKVVKWSEVAKGDVNAVHFPVRKIVETAVLSKAVSVILTHNHPGGTLSPSREDLDATEAAKAALGTIGVRLLDHLIVSGEDYYSLRENGYL